MTDDFTQYQLENPSNQGQFVSTDNVLQTSKTIVLGNNAAMIGADKTRIKHYSSPEYDNGNVTTTATIDWLKGNVQYVTMTGNTTFTFINPQSGMRCILHVAGAFTPTWPSTTRWPSNTTPTPTASAGNKDIYSFVYSGKESLYDGVQSANFPIT